MESMSDLSKRNVYYVLVQNGEYLNIEDEFSGGVSDAKTFSSIEAAEDYARDFFELRAGNLGEGDAWIDGALERTDVEEVEYRDQDVYDVLNEIGGYGDYNDRVESLMNYFGMTREEAGCWIDEYVEGNHGEDLYSNNEDDFEESVIREAEEDEEELVEEPEEVTDLFDGEEVGESAEAEDLPEEEIEDIVAVPAVEEEVAELDYLIDLAKLANGEAVAAIQYKVAAEAILGNNQSYLGDHFSEHADEEWGHYEKLNAALMQRGSKVDGTIANMLNDALPATEELTSFDSEYLRDFFEKAEDNAIKAYQEFYDKIEEVDKDLADIINGIISDERDHKLDMTRLVSEDNTASEEK